MWPFLRKGYIAVSEPANQPASKSKPVNLREKKRSQARFREREFERAGRVAKALGANLTCDPNTGIYTITFSDKADAGDKSNAGDRNPWDEVRINANKKRLPRHCSYRPARAPARKRLVTAG
jgi:hypothetical protein